MEAFGSSILDVVIPLLLIWWWIGGLGWASAGIDNSDAGELEIVSLSVSLRNSVRFTFRVNVLHGNAVIQISDNDKVLWSRPFSGSETFRIELKPTSTTRWWVTVSGYNATGVTVSCKFCP